MKFIKRIFQWIKQHKILSILGFLIVIILLFIFRPKPIPAPETQTVKKTNLIQSVSVSGSISAKKEADLSFLSSGLLVYLGAIKGDTVSTGQTLAVLDLRTVQKNLETSLLNYSEQRNTYDQNVANNGGRVNPSDALNDAMKRIIQNNQYDLDKAVKSVELQDLAKQQSVLVSPFNGILTRADAVTVGTTVTPTTIFSIIDPSSLVFAMDVDEADIGKVMTGQSVKLTLDAFPDVTSRNIVDRIDFISHTTSNGGNAFTVEVKLPESNGNKYRIGMNGNAEIITAERDKVLTVPIASVVDGKYVYVKTQTGYEKRNVSLGLQNDVDTEVTTGLYEGEIIVLDPTKVPQVSKRSKIPFFG